MKDSIEVINICAINFNIVAENTITRHVEDIKTVLRRDFDGRDEEVREFLRIIENLELLKRYLEFTKLTLNTYSPQEVQMLKERFGLTNQKEFGKVNIKEDLGLLSVTHSLVFIESSLLPDLKTVFERCLKKRGNQGYQLAKTEANLAKVKLAV